MRDIERDYLAPMTSKKTQDILDDAAALVERIAVRKAQAAKPTQPHRDRTKYRRQDAPPAEE